MLDEQPTASVRKYRVTKPGFYARCAVAAAIACLLIVNFALSGDRELRNQLVIGGVIGGFFALACWSAWKRRPTTHLRKVPTASAAMSLDRIETLNNLKRRVDAEDAARNFIAHTPGDHRGHEVLARALLNQRRPTEALAAAESSLALNPTSSHGLYLRSRAQLGVKQLAQAIVSMEQAIQIEPASAHLHLAKAQLHLDIVNLGLFGRGRHGRRGQWTLAQESAQRAVELDPSNGAALKALGEAQRELGDTDEAIANFERAIKLNPLNASALFELGQTLLREGDLERGSTTLMSAADTDPAFGKRVSQAFIPNTPVYGLAAFSYLFVTLVMVVLIVMALLGAVGSLPLYLCAAVLVGLGGVMKWAKEKSNLNYPPELKSRIESFQAKGSGFESDAPPPPTTVEEV